MTEPKYVITIGRQFGSGGRVIGQYIADKLGIKYYDKELLAEASKNSGVCTEFFEKADERSPSFFDNLFSFNPGYGLTSFLNSSSPLSPENIYSIQSDVIKKLSEENSCVIVGRSADYILRDHPCCINVFIHGSIESRVKRILERHECCTEEEAREFAKKRDKLRANFYNYYTDKVWGDAASYDMTVDSSVLSVEEVGEMIIEYAKMRIQSAFDE